MFIYNISDEPKFKNINLSGPLRLLCDLCGKIKF